MTAMTELYSLHEQAPERWDATALSTKVNMPVEEVAALLKYFREPPKRQSAEDEASKDIY